MAGSHLLPSTLCQKVRQTSRKGLSRLRRTKDRENVVGESETDTMQTGAPASALHVETADLAHQPHPETSPSPPTPSSPSPPASIRFDPSLDPSLEAPYYDKIAHWRLETPLPGMLAPVLELPLDVTALAGGAKVLPGMTGGHVVLLAEGASAHGGRQVEDLLWFGQSRHATRLQRDSVSQKLIRTRMGGKAVKVTDGTYAFVIDQDEDVLLSLTAAKQGAAAAGAHINLVAGLPVRFAGEIHIKDCEIIGYSPASGSYRTPPMVLGQARNHPLLASAKLMLEDMPADLAHLFTAAMTDT